MNGGAFEALLSTGLVLGMMAAVVIVFRLLIRRPASVTERDPPGLRTIVTFSGQNAAFLADDRDDEPYVGVRLFQMLCGGLSARRIGVENRGTVQYAQCVECVLGNERYLLVLEWIDQTWLVSVEWLPVSHAERRHLALTYEVFAPPDSRELRQLLSALDDWLKSQPGVTDVRWYRREQWRVEDLSDPSPGPIRC
ncbi:MAG: hypothetical protein HUU20_00570 [Pirellulales bacterium]|nr:hypothetical protein [Pirellulales bacterium]